MTRDPQHDFDFLFGNWKVQNRRLKEALTGSTEWVEFDATVRARPVWGGLANADEFEAPESPWGHIQGMTVRMYDPAAKQWIIYWANRAKGVFDTPMIGGFENGTGAFYDQELYRGRAIYVRFLWTTPSPAKARWEQSFSTDGGASWETNWVMELTREQS